MQKAKKTSCFLLLVYRVWWMLTYKYSFISSISLNNSRWLNYILCKGHNENGKEWFKNIQFFLIKNEHKYLLHVSFIFYMCTFLFIENPLSLCCSLGVWVSAYVHAFLKIVLCLKALAQFSNINNFLIDDVNLECFISFF